MARVPTAHTMRHDAIHARTPPMSKLRVAIAMLWTGLTAIPFVPAMLVLLPWRRSRVIVSSWWARLVSWGALKIYGITVEYEDIEAVRNLPPCILLANHSSNVDPFLAIWHCPFNGVGVAKKQAVAIPVFGQMYWLSGHLLINRENRQAAHRSMNETADIVQKHQLGLYIWPEGTMSNDGRLLPFKKGFVHFAVATRLPVIPLVIHDAHKLWPARTLDVKPGTIRVQMLDPIPTDTWTVERAGEIADEVRQTYIDALAPHQRPLES